MQSIYKYEKTFNENKVKYTHTQTNTRTFPNPPSSLERPEDRALVAG